MKGIDVARQRLFLAVAATLFAPCPLPAAQTQQAPLTGSMRATDVGAEPMMHIPDGVYSALAAAQHHYEIDAAAIAEKRTHSDRVRRLAAAIGADHQRALAALMRVGVRPAAVPASLAEPNGAMLQRLRTAPDNRFDQEYLKQIGDSHRHAWALQTGYASDGGDAALRATAQQNVAMEERHLHSLPMRPMPY